MHTPLLQLATARSEIRELYRVIVSCRKDVACGLLGGTCS